MKKISLLPYACGAGASMPGSEQGPLFAQAHNLCEKLRLGGIDAQWAADPGIHWDGQHGRQSHESLAGLGTPLRLETVLWHVRALAENVAKELRRGHCVVTIGGDHTLSAGSLAGMQAAFGPDARLGILWIDAHPDIHTFKSSISKALHGMPMATLTGLDDTLALGGEFSVNIKPGNIVFAGLRDIDSGEIENAKSLNIALPDMNDLRAEDIVQSLRKSAQLLAENCDHILLSIDLDAFEARFAPAVGSPVEGGFSPEEILPVLAEIAQNYSVPIIDIVEFNPTLPGADKTFDFMVDLLGRLFRRDE